MGIKRHDIELFIERLPTHQERTNTIDRSLGWLVGKMATTRRKKKKKIHRGL